MSQPIRGQGGHLVFPIGPKNTNLVEDVAILLPIKFRWIPFSGFRGEVENVSANQRQGRPSCFSDRPEKNKFGRGRWDLASCQVSLNSVQRFQRRSRKCEKLTTMDDRRTTDNAWSQVHLSFGSGALKISQQVRCQAFDDQAIDQCAVHFDLYKIFIWGIGKGKNYLRSCSQTGFKVSISVQGENQLIIYQRL